MLKHQKETIFVIINEFLKDYYNDSLYKLKKDTRETVRYLRILKRKFDNKIKIIK
jgi:hypothetical protein